MSRFVPELVELSCRTILTVKIGLLTALRDGITRSQSGNGTKSSGLAGLLGGGGGGSGGFNPLALLGGLAGLGGSTASSSASTKLDTFEDFDDVEEGDSVFTADES